MKPAFTFSEIREAEKNIIQKDGVPSLLLMENAGKNAFDIISACYPDLENRSIYIFCGKGNNAGDGFVIARHCSLNDIAVNIVTVTSVSEYKGDALINYEILKKLNSDNVSYFNIDEIISSNINPLVKGNVIIVDAILGTGISGKLSNEYEGAIEFVNSMRVKNQKLNVISIDVPSGLMSDEQINPVVNADVTITMAALKTEMLYGQGKESCGEIFVAPIGVTEELLQKYNTGSKQVVGMFDAAALLPKRKKSSYKYSNGKPLLIGGSKGMSGALIMSTMAAIRSGAGGASIAFPESLSSHFSKKLFDVVKHELNETDEQSITADSYSQLSKKISKSDAVLIGPGISLNNETKTFVCDVIVNCEKDLVIDADALTILAENIEILKNRRSEHVILTPHLGEFSRLSGLSTEEIYNDRFEVVRSFAKKYNVNVVMKSESTFSCTSSGEIYININSNESLALAGSGDVLSGIIAALLAQSGNPKAAMLCGNFIHGMMSEMYYEKYGNTQTASQKQLIDLIPAAITNLLSTKSK